MGLDLGDKRIGVALSDPGAVLASPLAVIDRSSLEADLQAIIGLATEHGVESIVIGLPRSLDGSIGQQAEKALAFSRALAQGIKLAVTTWDERLTTVAADRMMLEGGMKRARRKAQRDAVAAAIMLQAYLDSRRNTQAADPAL
jgi:putative Holliday junction resolvase